MLEFREIVMSIPVVKERMEGRTQILSPDDAWELCQQIDGLAKEVMVVITMDTKKYVIDTHLLSVGTTQSSIVHPRDVLHVAITDLADGFILAHNHPSGDTAPSAEDIKVTRNIVEAAKLFNIACHDHLVLGRRKQGEASGFLSLRESGLIKFGD